MSCLSLERQRWLTIFPSPTKNRCARTPPLSITPPNNWNRDCGRTARRTGSCHYQLNCCLLPTPRPVPRLTAGNLPVLGLPDRETSPGSPCSPCARLPSPSGRTTGFWRTTDQLQAAWRSLRRSLILVLPAGLTHLHDDQIPSVREDIAW